MRRIATVLVVLVAGFGAIRIYNSAFRPNGWRAYPTAVRADLRNLDAAQVSYHAAHGRYAPSLDSLVAAGLILSADVTVRVTHADETGYSAEGHHLAMADGAGCSVTRPGKTPDEAGRPQCRGIVDVLGRPRLVR